MTQRTFYYSLDTFEVKEDGITIGKCFIDGDQVIIKLNDSETPLLAGKITIKVPHIDYSKYTELSKL